MGEPRDLGKGLVHRWLIVGVTERDGAPIVLGIFPWAGPGWFRGGLPPEIPGREILGHKLE